MLATTNDILAYYIMAVFSVHNALITKDKEKFIEKSGSSQAEIATTEKSGDYFDPNSKDYYYYY